MSDFRDAFLAKVRSIEGFRAKPYGDYHQSSWGYGTKAPGTSGTITPEQADAELQREMGSAREAVTAKFPNLSPNQVEALSDATYNLGPKWMDGGALADAVQSGDPRAVQSALLLYNHAGGEVLPALTERRTWEGQHYAGDTLGDGAAQPVAESPAGGLGNALAYLAPQQVGSPESNTGAQASFGSLSPSGRDASDEQIAAPSFQMPAPPAMRRVDLSKLRNAIAARRGIA